MSEHTSEHDLSRLAAPVSRRTFLARSAVAAGALTGAGALLNACGGGSSGKTTVTLMLNSAEVTPAIIAEFEKLNPTIKVNFIGFDPTRLAAMLTAGNPPDIVRTEGASEIPNFIARGLCTDLTPYIKNSSVIKESDLAPINDVYRWDGKQQGQGPIYGLSQGWEPDVDIWYNKKLLDQAGVSYPSATTPISYDEMLDMARKLTVRQGGKIQTYGLDAEWGFVTQAHWYQMILQQGGELFNSDFTKVNLTTPEARKAMQWYVDWAQAHVGPSPLDPETLWDGQLFPADRLAMNTYGYWFGGLIIEPDKNGLQDRVGFAPGPQIGTTRVSACLTGTGNFIPSKAKNKDAAWKWMEYYIGGKQAKDRASIGNALPAIKSLYSLLPQGQPWQKQAYDVVMDDVKYNRTLRFSPYISNQAFEAAVAKYINPVMQGQASLDLALSQLNDTVNLLLGQGKQQIG